MLLQSTGLTEIQQAVRDHFQRGGSFRAVLLVLIAIIAAIVIGRELTRRLRRQKLTAPTSHPRRLFRDMQRKLELTAQQRSILDTVAKDLKMEHPSVMLLSPSLFDRCFQLWLIHRRRTRPRLDGTEDTEKPHKGRSELHVAGHLRAVLFPDG